MATINQQWTTAGPVSIASGIVQFDFEPSIGILTKDLDTFGNRIKSFKEPLKRSVQKVLIPSIQENFNTGGRPDAWEPLSPITIQLRKQIWGLEGGDILIKTGKLRKVMGQLNIWVINDKAASLRDLPGSVWYGKLHQAGYQRSGQTGMTRKQHLEKIWDDQIMSMRTGKPIESPKASIPARPFVMVQEQDEDAIQVVFEEWLEERIAIWASKGIQV